MWKPGAGTELMLNEYLLLLNLKPASRAPLRPSPWQAVEELTWNLRGAAAPCWEPACPRRWALSEDKDSAASPKGSQSRGGNRNPCPQNKDASGGVFNRKTRWRTEQLSEQFRQACCWGKCMKKFVLFPLWTKGLGKPGVAKLFWVYKKFRVLAYALCS